MFLNSLIECQVVFEDCQTFQNRKMNSNKDILDFVIDVAGNTRKLNTGKALERVNVSIVAERRRRFLNSLCKVAAVMSVPLAALSAWSLFQQFGESSEEATFVEVRATSGMIAEITLPDSSSVWLNSGSTLRYPSRFGDTRDVELHGEAYFKVAKDVAHKFHVKTSGMTIEVVGTEFNVDAYDDQGRSLKTTLVNGAINMHYSDAEEKAHILKIYPGQCAVMNADTKTVALSVADSAVASSWRYGKIYLNHTPAAEALRMIENRYNVRFDVKNERIYEHCFTGQFVNQRLDVVLDHFSLSAGMKFRRQPSHDGNNVTGHEIIEVR